MLTISGLKRFYYIPGVTDMRCGYSRLLQIVKQMTHHDPYNGDVFVFMSTESIPDNGGFGEEQIY